MIELNTFAFIVLMIFAGFGAVSVCGFALAQVYETKTEKEIKKHHKDKKPTYWCMGWYGTVELGFDDGTYLPRQAALILYPEYFDYNGEPILGMLPFDSK